MATLLISEMQCPAGAGTRTWDSYARFDAGLPKWEMHNPARARTCAGVGAAMFVIGAQNQLNVEVQTPSVTAAGRRSPLRHHSALPVLMLNKPRTRETAGVRQSLIKAPY
eukprot:3490798-Pyramimonas_sp.AAC.3